MCVAASNAWIGSYITSYEYNDRWFLCDFIFNLIFFFTCFLVFCHLKITPLCVTHYWSIWIFLIARDRDKDKWIFVFGYSVRMVFKFLSICLRAAGRLTLTTQKWSTFIHFPLLSFWMNFSFMHDFKWEWDSLLQTGFVGGLPDFG